MWPSEFFKWVFLLKSLDQQTLDWKLVTIQNWLKYWPTKMIWFRNGITKQNRDSDKKFLWAYHFDKAQKSKPSLAIVHTLLFSLEFSRPFLRVSNRLWCNFNVHSELENNSIVKKYLISSGPQFSWLQTFWAPQVNFWLEKSRPPDGDNQATWTWK